MLKLTAFEFIVRSLPEAFVFILASYALSNTKINIKRYIISSILFATCVYGIRMLPIDYGVHTILNIIIQIVLLSNINKIDIIQAIKSSIITFICLFILEILNVFTLSFIFKDELEEIMLNPLMKIIYGLPSLISFIIIIACFYIIEKGKIKNV